MHSFEVIRMEIVVILPNGTPATGFDISKVSPSGTTLYSLGAIDERMVNGREASFVSKVTMKRTKQ